ncbi:hypothetical protein [Streptomyces sp. NPDC021224]|uniref:hypothetical protein n=1 Tax=unclassified Streptomyces TaxID=2593676 RepID=UPI0037ACDFD1
MAEPTFTRSGTTSLYWTGRAGGGAAFLASAPGLLGDTPTLTRTWQDAGGCYVFPGAPAVDEAVFLEALLGWIASYAPRRAPRFLWVADPAAAPTAWVTSVLDCRPGPGGTWLSRGTAHPLSGYQAAVSGGGAVAPGRTEAGWGLTVADSGGEGAAVLSSATDRFPARPGTTLLSMEPGHSGAWRFALDLPSGSGDAFARLGAGIRFFSPRDDGYADGTHFAALRQPDGPVLEMYAQIDPMRPLDGDRTWLGFFSWAPGGDAPPLPSGYATVLGHDVTLRPLAAGPAAGPPARLVFGTAPYFDGAPGASGCYLTPAGPFSLDAGPDGGRVVCGTSGLEYIGVPPGGCTVTFLPGSPAYARGDGPLTPLGTTSWVRVEPPASGTAAVYYSQPEDAPLHTGGDRGTGPSAGGPALLGFLEVPAADTAGAVFPMAPFRGLATDAVAAAVALERSAIAPARRSALLPTADAGPAVEGAETIGVSPQGLAVGVAADSAWNWLGIGHDGEGGAPLPDLRFTAVSGRFRQAMQTNDLFMVLGDPDEFHRFGSVGYLLATMALNVIATVPADRGGMRPGTLEAVRPMADRTYGTRTEFIGALHEACADITEDETHVFLRHAGLMTADAGGWQFRLSPDNWGPSTYLIMKFGLGRSVTELVADTSCWAWPEAASRTGRPSDAQAALHAVVAAAADEPPESPYADFAALVRDPDWTGILALSAEVPLDQLPAALQVLGAGIDAGAFRAHHFTMPVTPFRLVGGRPAFDRSAMSGLIDYQNPEDQYFTEDTAFAFRVLRLAVGIGNSLVTTFTSRVELLVNRLFGAATRLLETSHGNNVLLDGSLQRQQLPGGGAQDAYAFSMAGEENTFQLQGPVLGSVELLSTQLVTVRAADPASGRPTAEAVFQMSGNLRFSEPAAFDPFCWGPGADGTEEGGSRLGFAGLAVAMSFAVGDPAGSTVFSLRDGNLSFDTANSTARPDSLVSRFPVRLAGLLCTADPALSAGDPPPALLPADLGYVSVTAPLEQTALTQPWYGLDYTVDLGTLGALAGSEALTLRVLAAWSPGGPDDEPGLYLGVRLPGTDGLVGVTLPLQGVVTMGFRSVEFLTDQPTGTPRTYTLRLRDFALRLLGLAFPPGHNDVILFGNPDRSGPSKVGWYLAYASDTDPRRPAPPPTRAETARRRPALRSTQGGAGQ